MWDWVINNVIAVALLIAFLITLCYALRLRSKMSSTSKPRFAFVTSATLASCLFALLSFLSGAGPMWIGNKILSGARIAIGDGRIPASPGQVGWFIGLMSLIGTVVALVLIYRFSVHAIRNWEGPVTVNQNDLAKREQDNSLGWLALAELKRLLARRPDPIASGIAVNWQQRWSDPPSSPPWHEFARSLFESAFNEASFNDSSWRDLFSCWMGEIHVLNPGAIHPLVLFVFDDEPEEPELRQRIEAAMKDGGSLTGAKMFAVYDAGRSDRERSVEVAGVASRSGRVARY